MILAIDTSASISVAATSDDGTVVLAQAREFSPRGHAELLADMVQGVLAAAHAGKGDVSAIVVGTGPAPFTGLRVGLVTARMLAFAWKVPLWGVCSLDAIGAKHGDALVVADARRREVYIARYQGGKRVSGPDVVTPGDVVVNAGALVVGRGAQLYPEVFGTSVDEDPEPQWLVLEAIRQGELGLDLNTEPLYLRRPDVHGA